LNPRNPYIESEKTIAEALESLGIAFAYEDTFFPTQVEIDESSDRPVEYGFCPDFRIFASDEWPEQYLEVTASKKRFGAQDKRNKIYNAEQIYGIIVVLLCKVEYKIIEKKPRMLLSYLVPQQAVAAASR